MDRKVVEVSSLSLFLWLSTYLLPTDLSMYLSIYLSIYLPIYLPIYYLAIYLSMSLSVCLPVCLSVCLKTKLLRDFLNFWKTQQFSETSSIFELDNVKNEVHFDFEMCFAPQRRALFRHLNFQKLSEAEVFSTFDLEMCFAPQRRAIFHLSSGQLAPHPPL